LAVPHAARAQLPADRLAVRVVASAVGPVTENDIVRGTQALSRVLTRWWADYGARSSGGNHHVQCSSCARLLGFVSPVWQCDADAGLLETARQAGVVVTKFDLIYELFDHIRGRLSDLLPVEVLPHSRLRRAALLVCLTRASAADGNSGSRQRKRAAALPAQDQDRHRQRAGMPPAQR
jgi:hypothetical protein